MPEAVESPIRNSSVNMGNILKPLLSKSAGKEMSPPKSLEDLLREFDSLQIASPSDRAAVDAAIESNKWARKFRDEHLRRRDLGDLETALRFLVATQPFSAKSAEAKSNPKKEKKLKKEMADMYALAAAEFFSEDRDQVCLSNQALFKEISAAGKRISSGGAMTEKDCELLAKARSDLDVTSNGLEPHFMKFMAKSNTQPSAVACILSIL